MIGTSIGPYKILSKLGEGGMGEVYRATDSKLDREVAIKLLPAAYTEDPERLARFEREAKLLAQLHHPNIASIFGLEESSGVQALVMELVEGPTLADRLELGPLSQEEVLSIAHQIAEALEEAHEKGIVHRDLKPQNIKAAMDSKVKVLDFGLAKAMDPAAGSTSVADLASSPALLNSPTLTAVHGTELGVILGTAAYMAPEQARGGVVDKRADIWAFGVVLYEMLTGEGLFAEGSVVDTLSAVMRKEVDLGRLPASTPPRLRELIRRCLERDPRNRLRDIGDARIVLDELREDRHSESAALPERTERLLPRTLAIAGALAVATLAVGLFVGRLTAPEPLSNTSNVGTDDGFSRFTRLTYQSGLESSPNLSPDGEFVAYSAIEGGDQDIFLLRVGGQRAINLTEDSAADEDHPAFSPDGRFIAFRSERAGGGLFVMGATGESVRRLTDSGDNPSWSPDGREIVFATEGESDPHAREKTSELWVVQASGGEPRGIFAGDAVQPAWSPSGHRIAFWTIDQGAGIRNVWTIAADGSDPQPVTNEASVDWNPIWAPSGSNLVFVSDRGGVANPWRVAIDEGSGILLGEPQPITLPTGWSGQLSLSEDGQRLVYRTSEMTAEVLRLPFDSIAGALTGPSVRLFETAIPAVGLDIANEGWLAFRTAAMQEDVYLMRVDGTGLRKLTDDGAKDRNPVCSPDGSAVAFYSNRSGHYEIWTIDRDASNLRQRTLTSKQDSTSFPVWSPDGRSIALGSGGEVLRFELQEEPVPREQMELLSVDRGDGEYVISLSWSPDGEKLSGVRIGGNGQLLGGVLVYDLSAKATQFLPIPPPTPPAGHTYPTLSWLPDSRRGVIRWRDRMLLVDTETGAITTLLDGLNPDGGIARISSDGNWIYMLDSRDEGDLWLASREP